MGAICLKNYELLEILIFNDPKTFELEFPLEQLKSDHKQSLIFNPKGLNYLKILIQTKFKNFS